jgi:hypothetical protein
MEEEGLADASSKGGRLESASRKTGLSIDVQERFSAILSRAGAVRELAVEGRLIASCAQHFAGHISISGDLQSSKYRFKLMQQPRGNLWQGEQKLVFDNTGPKYGLNVEATLLCWRMTSKDVADVPISVSCWIPQATKSNSTFSCEVELKQSGFRCENAVIQIPLENPREIVISQCDGTTEISEREGYLRWFMDTLDDENQKCEIEFSVPVCEEDAFFPVSVGFAAPCTICDLDVGEIVSTDEDGEVPELSVVKLCTAAKFEID